MINPWKQTSTLAEAESLSGISYPEIDPRLLPAGMKPEAYFCMNGLIEVRYGNGTDTLIIRRTNRSADNLTGDYNSYPASFDYDLNGMILHCNGTKEYVNNAEFTPYIGLVSIVMNPGQPGKGLPLRVLCALAEQFL